MKTGTFISHYKILEKLGEGGMGVVYKARDTKLDRDVALKFLPQHLIASEEGRQRFIREAKAAAALTHPNICTIHSVEEHNGNQFIVMELIDGVILREKCRAAYTGELQVNKAIDFALQIAEALEEAHTKGIVHRDIKPENILVDSKDRIKVMDFGLAKIKGAGNLTKVGSTVGTTAYMSPEQIQGIEVDHRSDIFSFGVVLYELLTGSIPFCGEHEAARMYSILNEEPIPLSSKQIEHSETLEQIIKKTLEKNPQDRFHSMNQIIDALRNQEFKKRTVSSWNTNKYASNEKGIVVLPFENVSPDKENEYFSDGLTEELISDLSKVNVLRVISRNSAMRLKGTNKDIRTLAKELDVQYILEGSVRKAGNAIRITAQLIDGLSDRQLWSDKYNGTLEDIFDVQENVSGEIVSALKITLSPDEEAKMKKREISNIHVYELYLRARSEILKFTKIGLDHAIGLLKKGIDIAGENELLYAGIGYVYWQYYNAGIEFDIRNLAMAEEYAHKIQKINPESAHAARLIGLVKFFKGGLNLSMRHLSKALEYDPHDPDTLLWLSIVYTYLGKPDEAIYSSTLSRQRDPLNPVVNSVCGLVSYHAGNIENAIHYSEQAVFIDLSDAIVNVIYAYLLAAGNRSDEAVKILRKLEKAGEDNYYIKLYAFVTYAAAGKEEHARKHLTGNVKVKATGDLVDALYVAEGFAMLGYTEEAINWIERAIELGNLNYPFISEHNPFLEKIRNEVRFKEVMNMLKAKWERIEV